MDRIAAMQIFAKVAETGSFTKAADALDVTKPTATRMVRALESSLGFQLLRRTTRASHLTMEGERYFQRCSRWLEELSEIESPSTIVPPRQTGRIRIDVDPSMASQLIIPFLPGFLKLHPTLKIDFHPQHASPTFLSTNADCAVRFGEIPIQTLSSHSIEAIPFVTCASPSYIGQFGSPAHPADLDAAHKTIGLLSNYSTHALPYAFRQGRDRQRLQLTHAVCAGSLDACCAAGAAGLGIVHIPEFAAARDLAAGRLVRVLKAWKSDECSLGVVHRPTRSLPADFAEFFEWMLDRLRDVRFVRVSR